MTFTTRMAGAVLLLVALAACRGDDPSLDRPTSLEIADELSIGVEFVGIDALSSRSGGGGESSLTRTLPCAQGGHVVVDGTLTDGLDAAETGDLDFDLLLTPSECVMSSNLGAITLRGDPGIGVQGTMEVAGGTPSRFLFSFEGNFLWSRQDGEGACGMNLTFDLHYLNPSLTDVRGSHCGYGY